MPNFDAGHYFLTVLAPVRMDPVRIDGQTYSRRHLIKAVLANLPSAERTVASQGQAPENPFARTNCTHFARFAVLDDVVFNGRTTGNTLLERLQGIDPLTPQKVDTLSTPFLVFVADFDAPDGSDAALRAITDTLWDSMRYELTEILQHCHGFDATLGKDGFFAYIGRCQIETTMPFNDYWAVPPVLPTLDTKPFLAAAALGLLLCVLAGIARHAWMFWVGLAVLAIDSVAVVRAILAAGQISFPTAPAPAPKPDLPTVLKALFMQRAFTDFAIKAQGLRASGGDDAALHTAFGTFLAATAPGDTGSNTQPPGVIGA